MSSLWAKPGETDEVIVTERKIINEGRPYRLLTIDKLGFISVGKGDRSSSGAELDDQALPVYYHYKE